MEIRGPNESVRVKTQNDHFIAKVGLSKLPKYLMNKMS